MYSKFVAWMYRKIVAEHKKITGVNLLESQGAWNVKQCNRCYETLSYGSLFCSRCGGAQDAPPTTLQEARERTTGALRRLDMEQAETMRLPAIPLAGMNDLEVQSRLTAMFEEGGDNTHLPVTGQYNRLTSQHDVVYNLQTGKNEIVSARTIAQRKAALQKLQRVRLEKQ